MKNMTAIYERYAYLCRTGIKTFWNSHDISDSLQLTAYIINNRYTHSRTHTHAHHLAMSTENCGLLCSIIRSTGENMICLCKNRHHYVDACKHTCSILQKKSCKSVESVFFPHPLLPFDLQKLQPNDFCHFATSTPASSYFLSFLGGTQAASGASYRAINYA